MTDLRKHNADPLERLQTALKIQREYLFAYEQPSEVLALETLRALDDLFLRDLMEPKRRIEKNEQRFRSLSSWGVNHALRRIVPTTPAAHIFRNFPSHDTVQSQADDFIFNCAALELGERYEGWLRDGIVNGEIRRLPHPVGKHITDALVLRATLPSFSDEEIGMAGLRWSSSMIMAADRDRERLLERRHRKTERELHRRVQLRDSWKVSYSSTPEIDQYFLEWARLYLKRIYSQDMVGIDDIIGGRPFSRYVEVLTALSARSQKHIAYAAILRARHPEIHIRNLLTTYADRGMFLDSLARDLDAERGEIENILMSLTLSGDNLETHTRSSETAWAPIVQASTETLLLPVYGLDVNPFLFLLTDLRSRYEKDWFRIANNRESRWIEEIKRLFEGQRWQTHDRNLKLRSNGKIETDIDFAALDRKTNELALFQLKWQHPIGVDNRARRSAGKNLISESNEWVQKVHSWLDRYGSNELRTRLGFEGTTAPTVYFFILGRYHVHFTGFDNHDARAIWSDWAHFQQIRVHGRHRSVSQSASDLRSAVNRSRARKTGQSLMLPVGDIALVLNPKSVPEGQFA